LPPFIPRLTDEDRQAAFPDVEDHAVHDRALHYFVLFDRLEWQAADEADGVNVDSKGWIGHDRDRLWFRAHAAGDGGRHDLQADVLYGRQVSRWWDVVGGIRQDVGSGPARTWAAIGVQGLAPYWFEIEATAYVGGAGRTRAEIDVEYELLLTNRLMLQPRVEVELFGRSDPERGIGAGLGSMDAGFRVRYEVRREIAPYVGVMWNRKYGKTAAFATAAGGTAKAARLVTGVRLWF
jgi:copper resistance protein B